MAYQNRRRVIKHEGPCPFCDQKLEPDYKEAKTLRRYLSDKGKIMARTRSGVCMKHQKRLAQAIKRARSMAMIPYVTLVRA